MRLKIYQVDAFTDRLFGGNPAAIIPLGEWLPDATMQSIAAENNLSETAFFVPEGEGYALRWFTPTVEVDLCGHATLASAFVISTILDPARRRIAFRTLKSGTLIVERSGDELAMDFPAWPSEPCPVPAGLAGAIGHDPVELRSGKRDYMAVLAKAEDVVRLQPDFAAIARLDRFALIVTAPGENGVDFVSRFFAPARGVDEDPVTGSAHCALIPYSGHAKSRRAAAISPARCVATASPLRERPRSTSRARSRCSASAKLLARRRLFAIVTLPAATRREAPRDEDIQDRCHPG
jgi:PhzF family phenazine biosynthesis protein